jgi:hypothetical protein
MLLNSSAVAAYIYVYRRRKNFLYYPTVADIVMILGYVRSCYVLLGGRHFNVKRLWWKFISYSWMAEDPMFYYAGRSSYALCRWQKFLCSSTLAEVPPSVEEVSMFYAGRSSYVLRRWQKFLLSSSMAEVLTFSSGGRNFCLLQRPGRKSDFLSLLYRGYVDSFSWSKAAEA